MPTINGKIAPSTPIAVPAINRVRGNKRAIMMTNGIDLHKFTSLSIGSNTNGFSHRPPFLVIDSSSPKKTPSTNQKGVAMKNIWNVCVTAFKKASGFCATWGNRLVSTFALTPYDICSSVETRTDSQTYDQTFQHGFAESNRLQRHSLIDTMKIGNVIESFRDAQRNESKHLRIWHDFEYGFGISSPG